MLKYKLEIIYISCMFVLSNCSCFIIIGLITISCYLISLVSMLLQCLAYCCILVEPLASSFLAKFSCGNVHYYFNLIGKLNFLNLFFLQMLNVLLFYIVKGMLFNL